MIRVQTVDQRRTRELRRLVLRPALGPDDPLPGDELEAAVHLAAIDTEGTVLSTCFVYPDPCPWLPDRSAWHLRQMATLPQRRGEGHGGAVLAAAVRYAEDSRAEVIWCNARQSAVGFYAGHGFRPEGPVFTDSAHPIPHQHMWRELFPAGTASTW